MTAGAPQAPGDRLLALLRIDQSDLLANREGRLGAGQRRNRRRANVARAVSLLFFGALFFAGAARSVQHGGQWLVPVVIGVVFIVLAALFATAAWRRDLVPVRCIAGRAQVVMVSIGRGGVVAKLAVDGERCGLPSMRNGDHVRRDFEAALRPDTNYRVYVVGKPGTAEVVGIEAA